MTTAAPTTAERIRSACVRSGGAMLAVEGVEPASTPVHHLLDDGSFAITVPGDGILAGMAVAAGTAGVQAVLEITDYAPLPLREPVRSLVWIRGRLYGVPFSEVSALLDPIAAENPNPALLQLNSDSVVDTRYALMGLDRYGVQLRVEGDDGDHDERLPFANPVDDVTGLSQAIRILMGCPFLNGLRARRL